MALKDVLSTLKNEGYIIKRLDQYLLSLNDKDEDRRWDINSPSSASKCERAIVYSRMGYKPDANAVDARTRRILDNGTDTHKRLQKYMMDEGMLKMDEVPVFLDRLQIQGHTDGLLELNKYELGILEIKTINTNSFSKLLDARDDHKKQALVYMVCLEERRKWLRSKFSTEDELMSYFVTDEYHNFIENHYKHIKGGNKFSRGEKLMFKYECHMKADRLLWNTPRPINKMIFLYEDKNTQELKEFTVKYDEELWRSLEAKFEYINECVAKKEIPPRPKEATSKSCSLCRWCSYSTECFVV